MKIKITMITTLSTNTKLINYLVLSSIWIRISASNWIILWLIIELNLLRILPIIFLNNLTKEIEALIKYLISQTIRSRLLLISFTLLTIKETLPFSSSIFLIATLFKLGIFPFHLWLPSIFNSTNWWSIFLLSSIQKIPPLIIILEIINIINPWLILIIIINAIIRAIIAINQTNLQPILCYSSIHHTSWLIRGLILSKDTSIIYFSIYTTLLLLITIHFFKLKIIKSSQLNINNSPTTPHTFTITIQFLSLRGIPPLIGFLPKILILYPLTNLKPIFALSLTLSSSIALFFYFSIFTSSLLSHSKQSYPLFFNISTSISIIIIRVLIFLLIN